MYIVAAGATAVITYINLVITLVFIIVIVLPFLLFLFHAYDA